MTIPLAATSRPARASALAWFAVLAPGLAWATQLVVGYAFQEAGCGRPDADLWGAGLDGLTAIVVVACGTVAALGGLAGLIALRASAGGGDPLGRVRFMAVAGVAASCIFLLAIVLTGIALLPLDACDRG
jgi:hypothetical protein